MSELQILTVVATLLGVTATVLNIVAFVREKDKSHTRTGLSLLLALATLFAILMFPRYAPEQAERLLASVPAPVQRPFQYWLKAPQTTATTPVSVEAIPQETPIPEQAPILGSFTIKIKRNMLGGIGALISTFQFSNSSQESVRVTAYHVRITPKLGETERSYDRVLSEPLVVEPNSHQEFKVELDAEIRDQWVSRERLEAAERGVIEITWECQTDDGVPFQTSSRSG